MFGKAGYAAGDILLIISIIHANGRVDVPLPDVDRSMTMQLPTVESLSLGRIL